MQKRLVKVLKKIVSSKVVDTYGYDVEIAEFDETDFEKGSFQTRYEPEVPSKKTLKLNSVYIKDMEPTEIKVGDKIKLNFSFIENDFEFDVEKETVDVLKIVHMDDGLEVYVKNLYVTSFGPPVEKWAV